MRRHTVTFKQDLSLKIVGETTTLTLQVKNKFFVKDKVAIRASPGS